jgi:hypothetical protein
MATPAELLAQSLQALRNAKRFSHTSNSYRKDNPNEYAKVIAYLDGGSRPSGVTTEMGLHALLEEDARRALDTQDPPPSGFPIPTFRAVGDSSNGNVFNQAWVLATSPTTPTGQWGGVPVRELQTPQASSNGSWEWWWLFQLNLTNWSAVGDQTYALPCDWHNVPGDVGWDDGTSGVSSVHMKVVGGAFKLQHERQQEAGSGPHEWTIISNVPRGQWHSVAVQCILGRLDGLVPAAGHPNGGKGRTRVWWNGAPVLDTGDINILHHRGSVVQKKMTVLEGMYNPNMNGQHTAEYTLCRFGRTKAEALADAAINVRLVGESDTGQPVLTRIGDRSSSDFVAP